MQRAGWLTVSLARKISVLFGTAVLLTIVVTLLFPWLQMRWLGEQALLMQANWVATAAYQAADVHGQDWPAAQEQLRRHWPVLVDELGVPSVCPEVVRAGAEAATAFQLEAIERLQREPRKKYYWYPDESRRLFRFALAIRGTQSDPHPHVLRGIIDVSLRIPQTAGAWNSIVTVLAGASGAVLAILVFYVVTQRLVLSPVHLLRRAVRQVATGDLQARSTIRSGDEFQQLSDAFNEMLTHLKVAQEELEKTNRSLDIRLGELAETNVGLYESNRLKSEFLGNVTHELRTPLVSIIGFAELLRDAWINPEADRTRLARYAENILISGRSLLEIINDLLDLTKIEAGKMELHLSDFSVADLCRDLVDFLRPLADKKNQELTLEVADDLPGCHGDSGKVRQILYNLLSNALKFTPPDGSIRLTLRPGEEGIIRISVRDTGPGISAEHRETIFDKFQQVDSSATREYEGTGLGLAITKDLVQMLGGSIRLESEPGAGATFVVDVPVRTTRREAREKIRLA